MTSKRIAAAIVGLALSTSASAQTVDALQGTWVLVSSITEKDGVKSEQFGSGANGMMTLNANGHFMLTIIGPDLPKFSSNNRATGTVDENKAVMSRSIAMIGTYAANMTDKTLTFTVETATFPNWNGTMQKRLIATINKDQLIYVTPTASIRDKPIAPGSPWQNGFAERLIGSIRRECVDHMVVLGEAHPRRILTKYAAYYNELRTHRSLNKDAPIHRAIQHVGSIVSMPVLGGLHHHYVRV